MALGKNDSNPVFKREQFPQNSARKRHSSSFSEELHDDQLQASESQDDLRERGDDRRWWSFLKSLPLY
jgi:hypothetical protein